MGPLGLLITAITSWGLFGYMRRRSKHLRRVSLLGPVLAGHAVAAAAVVCYWIVAGTGRELDGLELFIAAESLAGMFATATNILGAERADSKRR